MQVANIEMDRAKANALYRSYKEHRGAHTKEDAEIERIYYQISRGRKVIRALESIRLAGIDEAGRPKLALVRADAKRCVMVPQTKRVIFFDENRNLKSSTVTVEWEAFESYRGGKWMGRSAAMVPLIPIHLRPQASDLPKYHILWEADWQAVPVDPMLLRKIGADAWLVVAAWDLTAVEQAVLAGRL